MTLLPGRCTSRCLSNSTRVKLAPRLSKLSFNTLVCTLTVSLCVCWAPGAPSAGKAAGACVTTAAGEASVAGLTVAPTGGVALGKKVGLLPLCNCHWSHNMTKEKPKTTQSMVRRISFMVCLQSKAMKLNECLWRFAPWAQDRALPRTTDGNDLSDARLSSFPLPRHDFLARLRHKLNKLA